jgi:hypothetical protein
MEEVFKNLADSLGQIKSIEKMAQEGLQSINKLKSEHNFSTSELEQINIGCEEINKQLKNYKEACQRLSQVGTTNA